MKNRNQKLLNPLPYKIQRNPAMFTPPLCGLVSGQTPLMTHSCAAAGIQRWRISAKLGNCAALRYATFHVMWGRCLVSAV